MGRYTADEKHHERLGHQPPVEQPGQLGLAAHGHGGDAGTAPGHGGSALHTFASFDVAAHPVPTGREEQWRFTPLKRLHGLSDGSALRGTPAAVDVTVDAAPGVTVQTVPVSDPRVGSSGYVPVDRVAAQAWAGVDEALVVTVPAELHDHRPTTVSVRGRGRDDGTAAVLGRTVVVAEPLSDAVVVLDHSGSALFSDVVELVVGEGAGLTVVSVQDWADDATQVSTHHARLARDARLRHVAVTLGGDLVRVSTSVSYDAPGGDAELLGLYYADAGQHLEHRLFVDHAVPHCRSNVLYKGALQGDGAHTVWIGDVLIRQAAEGTDTYELNRNLVLTDGTRADSVPNLEIETGEIQGAGHASATGRFDDEQLFYLQSRGIAPEDARRLVVRGYFVDLIHRIGVPELVDRLTGRIEDELAEGARLPAAEPVGASA
jgi:Fe-S cluster assembly protein SufD